MRHLKQNHPKISQTFFGGDPIMLKFKSCTEAFPVNLVAQHPAVLVP